MQPGQPADASRDRRGGRRGHPHPDPEHVQAVAALLRGRSVVCLTGAGMSTDSGIPDYRGPGSPPRKPMTFDEFCSGPAAQRRYWSRAFVGWQHMARAAPNDGHLALARMQAAGVIGSLVTQNVDGLHGAAGSRPLIDLHGRIDEVICLDCREVTPRQQVQARLRGLNPAYASSDTSGVEIAPDGDALVDDSERFVLPGCGTCGGRLKPHVVFFGENVPKDRVAAVATLVDEADALLVVGSSLTVMSGFRFVRQAHRSGTPVVIVNRGATRGDDLADVRVDAGCSETMTALAEELASRRRATAATRY